MKSIKIHFDKLYKDDRKGELCKIAVPFPKGEIFDKEAAKIFDGEVSVLSQSKITAKWDDGSIKFLLIRFLADLPGNKEKDFELIVLKDDMKSDCCSRTDRSEAQIINTKDVFADNPEISNGNLPLFTCKELFSKGGIINPFMKIGGEDCEIEIKEAITVESGPVYGEILLKGEVLIPEKALNPWEGKLEIEIRLRIPVGQPFFEVAPRLINMSMTDIIPGSFCFEINPGLLNSGVGGKDVSAIHTAVGKSAYRVKMKTSETGETLTEVITADTILEENFEHFGEVLHGCLFADVNDGKTGVCATVFQPHQNFPKAVTAKSNGVTVHIIPEGEEKVRLGAGMAREQRFLLHFYGEDETLENRINRALIYQMPDEPVVSPDVFMEAGIFSDVMLPLKMRDDDTEIFLTDMADAHARGYGMMNWGDAPDANYTAQGRGGGAQVWVNNEYDYGHAMYMQYARSGVRRFRDYANVATMHQIDVDICHYSNNNLQVGGQWMHISGHNGGVTGGEFKGEVTPSHEWVEGLLDCYHFTGDERAYNAAISIGDNILKLLELPKFKEAGEVGARETGWALRAFAALYEETRDKKWLSKCEMIKEQFKSWRDEFGSWLQRYTDNTLIRVPFMISVAVISLEKYYRVSKDPEVKQMIISAVDDMIENAMTPQGLFYYKELPSLSRNGNNPLVLEALSAAYDLTGDEKYLIAGKKTFERILKNPQSYSNKKVKTGDAVLIGTVSPKNFAQGFTPLARFAGALAFSKNSCKNS
ncbi:MAG: glycoside hydrolase family 127 protein [Lachnospiraceae bacterium]|nr:glycoside hydrolase family 127 protein [Lachnospiraceae bacterium]MBR1649602.1 glycoside hydrolase family 127 protein [Lachnospiraceae bacterium]